MNEKAVKAGEGDPACLLIEARVVELERAARWLEQLCIQAGLTGQDAHRIDLVVAEALGNVVFHTFGGGAERAVELRWRYQPGLITVEIRDGGAPFDPVSYAIGRMPGDLAKAQPGGMGIILMRRFSDGIAYRRTADHNILSMSFSIAPTQPALLQAMTPAGSDRLGSLGTLALVAQCPVFQGVDRGSLETMIEACPRKHLAAGDTLLSAGQINHHLYVVLKGLLNIHLETRDSLASLSVPAGECVGELSIIDGKPASAYVLAETDAELLVISDEMFWERLAETPGLARNMLQLLSARIREHNQELLRALEARLRFGQLGRELAIAADIQASMLPGDFDQLREEFPRADIQALMEPARDIGGDFYDVFALDDDRICVALGDVSGKGMPAALFMVRSMTLLRTQVRKKRRLAKSLSRINGLLCENNPTNMFVTLVVAVVDLRGRTVFWVNAGHCAPMLLKRKGGVRILAKPRGILLGVDQSPTFSEGRASFRRGDSLVLYSDGVTEARDATGQLFGEARLVALLEQSKDDSAVQLMGRVTASLKAFVGEASVADDIALLVFHCDR